MKDFREDLEARVERDMLTERLAQLEGVSPEEIRQRYIREREQITNTPNLRDTGITIGESTQIFSFFEVNIRKI